MSLPLPGGVCARDEGLLKDTPCSMGGDICSPEWDKSSSFLSAAHSTDFPPVSEDGSGGQGGNTWPLMGLTYLSSFTLGKPSEKKMLGFQIVA